MYSCIFLTSFFHHSDHCTLYDQLLPRWISLTLALLIRHRLLLPPRLTMVSMLSKRPGRHLMRLEVPILSQPRLPLLLRWLLQPAAAPAQTFDAFGNGSAQPQQGNVNAVSDAFGNMNMGGGQPQINGTAAGDDDDDFGDFGGAAASTSGMPTAAAVAETKAKDPLSGLINLDGLQKNVQKTNNLNKPVVSGDAASQYMQYQQQMAAQGNAQNVGAQVSFNGIDGLNKMPTDFSPKGIRQNNRQPGQPIMAADQQGMGMNGMAANAGPGQDGGVSTGGSDAISSMFAPAPQGQQNIEQQGGQMMMGGGGNQNGGMMNQGQMNMGMQQGMQGGMNMQQQGMYNQQMNGNMMMNQGMPMQNQGMMPMQAKDKR